MDEMNEIEKLRIAFIQMNAARFNWETSTKGVRSVNDRVKKEIQVSTNLAYGTVTTYLAGNGTKTETYDLLTEWFKNN